MPDATANKRLKIEAHDASRVEWSVYIPLPHDDSVNEAEVSLRLEFPENVYVPHDGWESLQTLARLSSPDEDAQSDPFTFDGLRRSALGVARRMKLLRESIPRAALAHSLNPMPVAPALARDMERSLDTAVELLREARERLVSARPDDTPELSQERKLADEFLSGQLLELLTAADETCARMLGNGALPAYKEAAQKLRDRVAKALRAELDEREKKCELLPEADDPDALALFLDRGAQLKKHFQEVLFLEPETQMVDAAVRNWVGAGGAALAFVIYFGLQTLQTSAAAGLSIMTLMAIGAIAYALKDRAKELSRAWLTGKLSRLYANRVLVLREPARFEPKRNVVMRARESMDQARVSLADPLNPAAGAAMRAVTVHYKQRARVSRLRGPTGVVFERLKIVFRYDLAPILTRLDDTVKRVPVPAGEGVTFAQAPRLYHVRMSVSVASRAGVEKRDAVIVLSRRGIARIHAASADEPAAAPGDFELPELDDAPGLVPQG